VPENKRHLPGERLIAYLFEHGHVSPGDMANLCVEFETTREISKQVMRHWSMSQNELPAQEFSQRYADPTELNPVWGEPRLQDTKNRQQSIDIQADADLDQAFHNSELRVWNTAVEEYQAWRGMGMAREVCRRFLPEGLTPTRFDINGRIRSWLHFCDLRRRSKGAQKEIEILAEGVWQLLREHAPITVAAWELIKAKEEEDKRKIEFANRVLEFLDDDDMPTVTELMADAIKLGLRK